MYYPSSRGKKVILNAYKRSNILENPRNHNPIFKRLLLFIYCIPYISVIYFSVTICLYIYICINERRYTEHAALE